MIIIIIARIKNFVHNRNHYQVGINRMTQQHDHGRIYSLANAQPGDNVRVIDVSAGKLLKKRLVYSIIPCCMCCNAAAAPLL